ncbi:uncharacterized protein LOC132204467 [Neocloeon triangulifer]|uniref:uncharacterized protein LOC132204467 n=1 Tax=Neocloeon triangulifer TaxID=2078957 RepID=UPI00286F0DE2|nr:uncharacterized protein LOC132204467 [Neocloeon triangulifer]XP_059488969.1 uncharacterized protein LOC132204467 [Neocloeon triangulifer]
MEVLNGVSVSARNNFKRLLLEKGCPKGGERRMSAVEQLMASKGQFSPTPSRLAPQQTTTLHHSLNRRRYRHTDVLSTTIAEESEPQGAHKHITASYLQHRIDQMCLSPRLSASPRMPIITSKPLSPSKMSLETSLKAQRRQQRGAFFYLFKVDVNIYKLVH